MALFGGGAVLAGLVLGSIATFVIDRQFVRAVIASGLGAALSFIGLIHGEKVELNAAGALTIGYLIMALIFGLFALQERRSAPATAVAGPAGDVPAADAVPAATLTSGEDLLFVNGTLMSGLALHANLEGAEFVGAARTAPRYRIHSIDDVHPGMYEVSSGGVSVEGELYRVPDEVWRRVEEGEPEHLYRGPVHLEDGRVVPGILYPQAHIQPSHRDISEHGGWRRYAEQRDASAGRRAKAREVSARRGGACQGGYPQPVRLPVGCSGAAGYAANLAVALAGGRSPTARRQGGRERHRRRRGRGPRAGPPPRAGPGRPTRPPSAGWSTR